MNHIWISRDSTVSVREQLSAQLLLAILSRRIRPAEKLPSVRELARRIKIHPNTVSAAYQDLAARGWVTRKAGSGVFVNAPALGIPAGGIDEFVRAWIEESRSRGFGIDELRSAIEKAQREITAPARNRGLIVVHPDKEFARILAAEIAESLGCPVPHASSEDASGLPDLESLLLLTTASGSRVAAELRPQDHRLIALKSVEDMLHGLGRPAAPALIAVVSRSETILKWASMLIPALGLKGSDVVQRNPARRGWRNGLGACDLIAADVEAARELPKNVKPIMVRVVADSFLMDARSYV